MIRNLQVIGRSLAVVASVALLGMLGAGCSEDEEPAPPPPAAPEDEEPTGPVAPDVAIVISPEDVLAPEVAARIRTDLDELAEEYGDSLDGIRLHQPDDSIFVRDVATVAIRDGADLLCMFGAVGRQFSADLLAMYPSARFCAMTPTDPPEEATEGIDVISVRISEVGHLLGSAASELTDEDGGVVLALGSVEMERGPFREGLRAALGEVPEIDLDDELAPDQAIVAAVADGADVVIVGTGPDAPQQAQAALDAGVQVIAHAAVVDEDAEVAATWHVRWDVVFRPAIDRAVWPEIQRDLEFGVSDGILELFAGPAAPDGLQQRLDAIAEALDAGQRDPLEPIEETGDEDAEEASEPSSGELEDAAEEGDGGDDEEGAGDEPGDEDDGSAGDEPADESRTDGEP